MLIALPPPLHIYIYMLAHLNVTSTKYFSHILHTDFRLHGTRNTKSYIESLSYLLILDVPPRPSLAAAYIRQDWCVTAAAGSVVPEVHLVWCCRSMAEMELVGEAIPSMLASAGSKNESHFTLTLYCTSKVCPTSCPP